MEEPAVRRAYFGPATAVRRLPRHGVTLLAHGNVVSLCTDVDADEAGPQPVCRASAVVHGFATAETAGGHETLVIAYGGRGATFLRVAGAHAVVVAQTGTLPDACVAAAIAPEGEGPLITLGFAHGFVEHWCVDGDVLRRVEDKCEKGGVRARCWAGADVGECGAALVGAMTLVRKGCTLFALTADPFGAVTVWDAHTGHCYCHVRCHEGPVHCIAVEAEMDAQSQQINIATCSTDRTTRLWTLTVPDGTNKEEKEEARLTNTVALYGHGGRVWVCACVRVDAGAVLVASGGEDGSARLWTVDAAGCAGSAHVVWAHGGKHVWALDLHRGRDGACVLTTGGADGGVVASWVTPDAPDSSHPTPRAVHPPAGCRGFALSTLLPAPAPAIALFVCDDGTLGIDCAEGASTVLARQKLPFQPSAISRVVPVVPHSGDNNNGETDEDAEGGGEGNEWLVAVAGPRGELAVVEFCVDDFGAATITLTPEDEDKDKEETDGRVVSVFAVRATDAWLFVTCTWRGVLRVWRRADTASPCEVLVPCGACELPPPPPRSSRGGAAPHCVATCCAAGVLAGTQLLLGDEHGALHCVAVGAEGIHCVRTWNACHEGSRMSAVRIVRSYRGDDDRGTTAETITCGYDGCVCRWALAGLSTVRPRLRCAARCGAWQGMHQLEGFAGPGRAWGLHCGSLVVQAVARTGDVRTYATIARRRDFAARLTSSGPLVLAHRRTALALERPAAAPGALRHRIVLAAPTHAAETNRVVRIPFALAALPPLFPCEDDALEEDKEEDKQSVWFVTASRDRTLRVWELHDRAGLQPAGVVAGHTSTVRDVAFCTTARGAALAVSVGGNFELLCHHVLRDSARPCLAPLCSGQGALEAAQARDRGCSTTTSRRRRCRTPDGEDENRCRIEAVAACSGTAPDEAWLTCGASDGRLYSLVLDAGVEEEGRAPSVRPATETPVLRLDAVPLCMRTIEGTTAAITTTVVVGLSSGDVAVLARTREGCCVVRTLRGVLAAGVNSIAHVGAGHLLCVGDDGALALAHATGDTATVLDHAAGLGAALVGVAVVESAKQKEERQSAVFVGLSQRVGAAVCDGAWRVAGHTHELLTDVADAKDVAAWHDITTRTITVVVVGQGVESLCVPDEWMML